jgi:hypothetical protein
MAAPPMNSQASRFSTPKPIRIAACASDAGNADRLYWPQFLNAVEAQEYPQKIRSALHWEQRKLGAYNKDHLIPRLVAWCVDTRNMLYPNVNELVKLA